MGELHESSPDPGFGSQRLCIASHQIQEGDQEVDGNQRGTSLETIQVCPGGITGGL